MCQEPFCNIKDLQERVSKVKCRQAFINPPDGPVRWCIIPQLQIVEAFLVPSLWRFCQGFELIGPWEFQMKS